MYNDVFLENYNIFFKYVNSGLNFNVVNPMFVRDVCELVPEKIGHFFTNDYFIKLTKNTRYFSCEMN